MIGASDSLVLRLMGAIAAALCLGALLSAGTARLAGRWAGPTLERSSLPPIAAQTVRVLQAAPAALRPELAWAASTPEFRVDWFANRPIGAAAVSALKPVGERAPHLLAAFRRLGLKPRSLLVFTARDAAARDVGTRIGGARYPHAYYMLVGLKDRSWLVFTVYGRVWGADSAIQLTSIAVLAFGSATLVATFYGRLLAQPIRAFTRGVNRFTDDIRAEPLAERGPSELRIATAAVNAMQSRIQSFLQQRTLLLATISHDLRTPLTRLRLRSEAASDPEFRRNLLRDIDEMTVMVDGALALFQDERADDEPTTLIDMGALVRVVADDLSDEGHEVALTLHGLFRARGRPWALTRAIRNVVENALRYGESVEIEVLSRSDAVFVEVCDRGPGLPSEALERVFQPFQRLDVSAGHTPSSVGLGLTSARSIMIQHAGSVTAQNRSGGGLKVVLRLPAALD